jgi:molybdopterin-guanine dinucleotide biosynthesis protein MobB
LSPERSSKVMSFVGPSGCGKTTLICRLLDWFLAQGLRVAVLKHSHKTGLGDGGKDTGKFRQAGAQAVALAAPGLLQVSRFFPDEPPLSAALEALAPEADLILVEGYKTSSLPKIALAGPDLEPVRPDLSRVVALVSSAPVDSALPVFHPQEVAELGSFIREYLGLSR